MRRRREKTISAHKKDFSWAGQIHNPYRDGTHISPKKRIESALLIVILGISLWMFLAHPFFSIQNVAIRGLERISETEFRAALDSIVSGKKLFFFPGKSYILLNVDEVRAILEERFPLESLLVEKRFPHTLRIEVKEKLSTIIYDNSLEYSLVGLDGRVVEIMQKVGREEWADVPSSTPTHIPAAPLVMKQIGDYPVVYDARHQPIEINTRVLENDTVRGIVDWFNFLDEKTNIAFRYMVLEDERGEAVIYTGDKWTLRVQLNSREAQFDQLLYVLEKKIDRNLLEYIDVRYPGRVYWQ